MKVLFLVPLAGILLSGCAMWRNPHDPARNQQSVVVINAISWPDAVGGQPQAARSSWPLAQLANHEEVFPLAQVKHCPATAPCAWGVLAATRSFTRYQYEPGGITLDLGLNVDVHRRQPDRRNNQHTSVAIAADVPALSYQRSVLQSVSLPYGQVYRIDMEYGIRYQLCAQRVDAAGRPLDRCLL